MAKKHWKARDAQRGAIKKNQASIVLRWQNDARYRESQKAHGWTEDYCRYLDYLTTIDISYSATWQKRNQHENTILMVFNDDDKQAGPMRARKDFKSTTQTLTDLPREREHGKDPSMKHCEQTWNGTANIGKPTGRKLPFHHLHNNGGNTNTKTLNGEINIGGKSDGYRLLSKPHRTFFADFVRRHQRMSCTRRLSVAHL